MGVKDLWSVLSPSCEKKSLWELQGLTIAIDLSSWIVDSQNIRENTQVNLYLRNLFFRTSYLLLLGVKPIFILEGKAPKLKHRTIALRLHNFKESEALPKNKNGHRGRLNCLQKKCEELLLSLGVHCYKSEGEAEALCSKLNEMGIVDAVISQDSDCFLYGAQVVLRNFTMSPSYTCDMYTMENIGKKLNLGRQKLLALSLLCGCDYEIGIQGIGKQSALKFLSTISDDEVLGRLRAWRNNGIEDSRPNLSQMSQEEKLEYNIQKKAVCDPNFPSEEVITEYLSFNTANLPQFVWTKPTLSRFVVIAERMLGWDDDYVCCKFIPLVSRWHLLHGGANCGLKIETIVKKRLVRSMPSYEVQWQHDGIGTVTTIEPTYLIVDIYPEIHEAFMKSQEKPKKGTKPRKKKNNEEDHFENIENLLSNLSIDDPQLKKPNNKQQLSKQRQTKGQQTLDTFLLKDIPVKTDFESGINETNQLMLHSTPFKSVIKTKSCNVLSEDSLLELSLQKSDVSIIHQPLAKNSSPDIVDYKLDQDSISFQCLTDSLIDSAHLDLSDIVNTIVTRPTSNQAVKIWTRNY